jgi:Secretion system C-terminal sorting domain
MKKNLLFSLIITFYSSLFAQNTNTFPTVKDNPKWYIETFYNSFTASSSSFGFLEYIKDTTVCGQKYDFGIIDKKPFFVRPAGAKTYLRTSIDCQQPEELIYDFDMKVGDSLEVKDFTNIKKGDVYKFLVTKVDSIIIKGQPHKRLNLKYSFYKKDFYGYSMDWIERIGSNEHPIYPMVRITGYSLDATRFYNLCTYYNNSLYYSNSPKCLDVAIDTISFPMFKNSPSWSIGVYPTFFPPYGINKTEFLKYQKDTTICKRIYSKISFNSFYSNKMTTIFVRTEGKKVYYLPVGGDCIFEDEKLLYDFSLELGDIVVIDILNNLGISFVEVKKVETVMLFGKMRKKMTLEIQKDNGKKYEDVWIEGVGSIVHPFYALLRQSPDGNWGELLCASSNMLQQYKNPKYSFCSFFVATEDVKNQTLAVDVFPNPFDSNVNINILGDKNLYHNVELFNHFGQKLLEQNFETSCILATDFLPKGIYFLKIQTADKQFFVTKKIVK